MMREPQKALERFHQALQIAQALGDKFRQGSALERFFEVYRDLEELGRALEFGVKALRLYQASGEKFSEAVLNYVLMHIAF
jgi:tetratricopeptide (TPR) repeat protein